MGCTLKEATKELLHQAGRVFYYGITALIVILVVLFLLAWLFGQTSCQELHPNDIEAYDLCLQARYE